MARNRERLMAVAEQQKRREYERYLKLIEDVERSRANLLDLRQAELYAALCESDARWGSPSPDELRREREGRHRYADLSGRDPRA